MYKLLMINIKALKNDSARLGRIDNKDKGVKRNESKEFFKSNR